MNEPPKVKIEDADKVVHFTFHFVFTVLWFLYLDVKKPSQKRLYIKVLLVSICYGGFIEIAQGLFTTNRSADIADVLFNSLGALAGIAVLILSRRLLKSQGI